MCSVKKVFLEISQNSQEKKKERLWHRCFTVNFAKFLRTSFLKEHLWTLLWQSCLADIYLFKFNKRNNRKCCDISSKLTIKTTKRCQWSHWRSSGSGIFVVNSELLLILNFELFQCFYCGHWTSTCQLGTSDNKYSPENKRQL